jgi:hypothetical protein
VEQRYVGIDLHRRRSVIYTMDAEGEKLSCVRIANEPSALMAAVAPAGDGAHVVIEATYGWYWAVDLLRDNGFDVHLAHPSGNDWGKRRVKNDERDARDLADLLRLGRLAEAWIAPATVRELRELVRYRAKLVNLRSGLKTQVHAVMAKEGVLPSVLDMFGPGGAGSSTRCSWPSPTRCASSPCATWCPSMTERSSCSSARSSHPDPQRSGPHHRRHLLCRDRRCLPLPLRARVVLLGGARPPSPGVGHQGGAGQHHQDGLASGALGGAGGGGPLPRGTWLHEDFCGIAERRGKKKARVAVAHKMLTLVYCGLRDGEIRCLRDRQAA